MTKHLFPLFIFLFCSCSTTWQPIQKVIVTPVYEQQSLGSRAIAVTKNKVYFAGAKGVVGEYDIQKDQTITQTIDSTLEFRALSIVSHQNQQQLYLLNIGSPAYLWHGKDITDLDKTLISRDSSVFMDAIAFNRQGIGFAMGDPLQDCLYVMRIENGKPETISCENFPKSVNGEAAFAASNTNIKIIDKTVWMISGGTKSRLYRSKDFGKSWQVFETPIIQGKPTQGMFSIDFYDQENGVAIGGDYTLPDDNKQNLTITKNGGETWDLVQHPSQPGYRSCIQYIPNSNAQGIIVGGFRGIDISNDAGKTWKHVSDQSIYTLQFLNSNTAYAAGNDGIYKIELQ